MLRQDEAPFKALFTNSFAQGPEKHFIKLCNICFLTKLQDIAKFTAPSSLGPHTFYIKINTSKHFRLVLSLKWVILAMLQIRAIQRPIAANLWFSTLHIYDAMIIVTGGFSKKSFLLLLPGNYFERSSASYLGI